MNTFPRSPRNPVSLPPLHNDLSAYAYVVFDLQDKQAVEQYKAGIKEKLIKAGMVRGQPRTPVAPSTGSSSTSSSRSAAASANDVGAGSSRGGMRGMHGGHAHAHGPSHYTPYPSPHQYGSHNSMLAAAAAAGAGLSPMLGANQQYSGMLPNLMGGSDPASSLTIDYAREISQPGLVRRGSYTHQRLPTQHQQVSMRMNPGRGSISSEYLINFVHYCFVFLSRPPRTPPFFFRLIHTSSFPSAAS